MKGACTWYNWVLFVLLVLLHAGAIYWGTQETEHAVDREAACWFLMGVLYTFNLRWRPHDKEFCTWYNRTMILLLAVIYLIQMFFGSMKKGTVPSDGSITCTLGVVVEVCALVAQDGLIIMHIYTAPDPDAEVEVEAE